MKVQAGAVVSIYYVIFDESGAQVDATPAGDSWSYVQGSDTCPPGLEAALEGREVGARVEVPLPPEQTYGAPRPDAVFRVDRARLPPGPAPEVGQVLAVIGKGGETELLVIAVDADSVTVDGNHPLAGRTLTFSVEVADVRPATAGERLAGEPLPLGA